MTVLAVPPLPQEPAWTPLEGEDGLTKYTRPLLGSEYFLYEMARINDGTGSPCLGVVFTSGYRLVELIYKLVRGLALVRFSGPLLGATVQLGLVPDDPKLSSWVYTPVKSAEAAEKWAMHSLEVVHRFDDPNDFVQDRTSRQPLPYQQPDGSTQYFRCYLLVLPDNKYGLFTFGTHAILDAHPNLNLLNLLLQSVNRPQEVDLNDVKWGEEWKNLPPGAVAATGGPYDGWTSEAGELLGRFHAALATSIPTHTLRPCRLTITKPGLATRVQRVLDQDTTQRILVNLKKKGFTITQLAEASLAIATFEHNPDIQSTVGEAHVTLDGSLVSLFKYMVPPFNKLSHLVSAMAIVPVKIPYSTVSSSEDPMIRLCNVLDGVKATWTSYLSNPQLPHFTSFASMQKDIRDTSFVRHPWAMLITNIGVIDRLFPVEWRDSDTGDVSIKVHDLVFGHRLTDLRGLAHVWTINGCLHLQLQANEAWDRVYMEEFGNRMLDVMKVMA